MMKDCRHQNIVAYYGSYLRRDRLWICMEYCGGGSLQDIYHSKFKYYSCCYSSMLFCRLHHLAVVSFLPFVLLIIIHQHPEACHNHKLKNYHHSGLVGHMNRQKENEPFHLLVSRREMNLTDMYTDMYLFSISALSLNQRHMWDERWYNFSFREIVFY